MKLKNRLLIQNVIVAAVTVFVTAALGLFCADIAEKSGVSVRTEESIAVVRNGEILYKSGELSEFEIKNAIADKQTGKNKTRINEKTYIIKTQQQDDATYIMRLIPATDEIFKTYRGMIVFLLIIFTLVYFMCETSMSFLNNKKIAQPIKNISKDANRLSYGDFNISSQEYEVKEINDLASSIEKLRNCLKSAVVEKEKYDENRKELISGISHDLKTPITAIRGYVEIVLDGSVADEEKKRKYLQSAVRKTEVVKNLIDDLLLYSKLDLNQIPFEIERVNISEYVKKCAYEMRNAFEREKKEINFCAGCENVFCEIDTKQFERVIENVLSNAKKNIETHTGFVNILLRETKKTVIIEIKDNGCGISENDLKNIFNRFYRGDNARKNDGSSGLGLTIAQRITEGLGGKIWATSRKGEGTSVMISLRKA